MQGTARKLKLAPDKLVATVDAHGNTSAASIPLALDVACKDGRVKRGDTVLLEGVGGGFTWGAVLLDFLKPASILAAIEARSFAFVFPGQGAQSVGMLDAWGDHPPCARCWPRASQALGEDIGRLIHEGPRRRSS